MIVILLNNFDILKIVQLLREHFNEWHDITSDNIFLEKKRHQKRTKKSRR